MKNILVVTGGAGFVGSNLIELLIQKTKYKIVYYLYVYYLYLEYVFLKKIDLKKVLIYSVYQRYLY